ncbi:MAG: CoA pyrophosphatase [Gammaproteobacteria bacterium]
MSSAGAGHPDLRDLIRRRLAGSQPQPADRINMPGYGDLPQMIRRLRIRRLVPAAVLVPIIDRPAGLSLLLTRRAEDLKHHPGQISFPGGRLESGDRGPAGAALRETREEVGLPEGHVEIVGYLDNYLTITGYAVTPVVAFVRPGFELELDTTEVAEAFEVPLTHVLDRERVVRRHSRFLGLRLPYFEIPYRDYNIWGATAGMLISLRQRLFEEQES